MRMLHKVLFVVIVALLCTWFVMRPQGRSWEECATIKGIVCIPKVH